MAPPTGGGIRRVLKGMAKVAAGACAAGGSCLVVGPRERACHRGGVGVCGEGGEVVSRRACGAEMQVGSSGVACSKGHGRRGEGRQCAACAAMPLDLLREASPLLLRVTSMLAMSAHAAPAVGHRATQRPVTPARETCAATLSVAGRCGRRAGRCKRQERR